MPLLVLILAIGMDCVPPLWGWYHLHPCASVLFSALAGEAEERSMIEPSSRENPKLKDLIKVCIGVT